MSGKAPLLYRLLLLLLPRRFRREFGADLEAVLVERLRDAPGASAHAWIWLVAVVDVLASAPSEWARALRRQRTGNAPGSNGMDHLKLDLRIAVESFFQDLRLALRRLRRSPGFTGVATFTLALAIGANVALFTVVNGVLLRPLSYPDSERIVEVRHHSPRLNLPELGSSSGLIEYYRESARTLTSIAGIQRGARNLVGGDRPEQVGVAEVTPEYFDVLRTRPAFGRPFVRSDGAEGAAPVTILLYDTWQSRFGGDPGVVGRQLEVDGRSTEVVGVMPAGFEDRYDGTSLLLPLQLDPDDFGSSFGMAGVARLAAGADLGAARVELAALQDQLPERFPALPDDWLERAGWSVSVEPLRQRIVGDVATTLWVLFGSMGLVLLIAGANVANLFLVRAEWRRREMAVRSALGASQSRIARSFVAESVLLGLLAGVVGVVVAGGAVELFLSRGPAELPRLHEIAVDSRVLAFAAALTVLSGLVLGALPVPRLARDTSSATLHGGMRGGTAGRERHRVRQLLIVGQMAMALVLLVGAGLMLRSVQRLYAVDPGFQPENVLAVGVSFGERTDRGRAVAFHHAVLQEVAALPGVTAVGATNSLPVSPAGYNGGSFDIESRPTGDDDLQPVAMWSIVTDGYFRAMGVPLLQGRPPVRADAEEGRRVAWVNETFARRFLDGRALGERLRIGDDTSWVEIVGVVGDVRNFGLDRDIEPWVSLPMTTAAPTSPELMQVVARTEGVPTRLAPAIRAAVESADPAVPLTTIQTMDDVLAASLARRSFTLVLVGIAAGAALLLGVVGLYGVISYIVSLRTKEIGVRVALGAKSATVRRMVLRQGLGLALAGMAVGLVAATAAANVLSSLLFEVSGRDPVTFAVVAVLLLATSLLATYLPARRATRVDPMTALRGE